MPNDLEFTCILHELSPERELIPLPRAKNHIPSTAGIYAIFFDSLQSLPIPFKEELEKRNKDYIFNNLLYLGNATKTEKRNLNTRLVKEKLTSGTQTFFREFSAMLGCNTQFWSLRNYQNKSNYKFRVDGKMEIIEFI